MYRVFGCPYWPNDGWVVLLVSAALFGAGLLVRGPFGGVLVIGAVILLGLLLIVWPVVALCVNLTGDDNVGMVIGFFAGVPLVIGSIVWLIQWVVSFF